MPSYNPTSGVGFPSPSWEIDEHHWLANNLIFTHSGIYPYIFGSRAGNLPALNTVATPGGLVSGLNNTPVWVPDGSTASDYVLPVNTLNYPITLSVWAKGILGATKDYLLSVRAPLSSWGGLQLARSAAERAEMAAYNSGGSGTPTYSSIASFVSNEWQHFCAVFESATSRTVYLNAGGATSSAISRVLPTNTNIISIGRSVLNTNDVATTVITGIAMPMVIRGTLAADEVTRLYLEQQSKPYSVFRPRRIFVPVSAGGTNTYTFSVSGGATFSGTSPLVKERVQTPSGGIAFAGAPVISHERAIEPSGQVTFSGSAPIVTTATYQFGPSGGVTFSGAPPVIKEKIIPVDGGVNFGGSSRLIFVPVGGVGNNDSDRISVGVSRKIGVS